MKAQQRAAERRRSARQPTGHEQALITRALAGDTSAFDALVVRYERPIYNLAYRIVGSHHDAQELAQDTFVRAYLALPRFRRGAAFYSWLYRIAWNLWLDEVRRRRRHPVVPQAEVAAASADDPQDALAHRETRHVVLTVLQQLPVEFRSVIVLRDLLDMTYEEIAQIERVPLGTVKSRLHRARQMARERLTAPLAA